MPTLTIPKMSAPLVKLIRTFEGVLILVSNVLLVLAPIVSSSVTAADSVKYGVILNGVTIASRSILKAVAALSPLGAPAEIVTATTEASIEKDAGVLAGQAASDVSRGASLAEIADQAITDEQEFATQVIPPVQPVAEPAPVAPPPTIPAAPLQAV